MATARKHTQAAFMCIAVAALLVATTVSAAADGPFDTLASSAAEAAEAAGTVGGYALRVVTGLLGQQETSAPSGAAAAAAAPGGGGGQQQRASRAPVRIKESGRSQRAGVQQVPPETPACQGVPGLCNTPVR